MRINALAPTDTIVLMNGATLRVWHGETEDGAVATMLVARVIVSDAHGSRRLACDTAEVLTISATPT
jgi:hypothetical protein